MWELPSRGSSPSFLWQSAWVTQARRQIVMLSAKWKPGPRLRRQLNRCTIISHWIYNESASTLVCPNKKRETRHRPFTKMEVFFIQVLLMLSKLLEAWAQYFWVCIFCFYVCTWWRNMPSKSQIPWMCTNTKGVVNGCLPNFAPRSKNKKNIHQVLSGLDNQRKKWLSALRGPAPSRPPQVPTALNLSWIYFSFLQIFFSLIILIYTTCMVGKRVSGLRLMQLKLKFYPFSAVDGHSGDIF